MQGPDLALRVLAITEGMNSILQLLFDYEAPCDILESSRNIYGVTENCDSNEINQSQFSLQDMAINLQNCLLIQHCVAYTCRSRVNPP